MYGMWYLVDLTKLCAYSSQFMFPVLQFSNEGARDDCRAHTTCFPHFMISSDIDDISIHFDNFGFIIIILFDVLLI